MLYKLSNYAQRELNGTLEILLKTSTAYIELEIQQASRRTSRIELSTNSNAFQKYSEFYKLVFPQKIYL